jgi:hypothetical protein
MCTRFSSFAYIFASLEIQPPPFHPTVFFKTSGWNICESCREAEKERATERQNILREKEAARRLLIRLQVRGCSSGFRLEAAHQASGERLLIRLQVRGCSSCFR